MKFGNWKVSEKNIEWSGKATERFVIEKDQLTQTDRIEEVDEDLYKWILLATNEEWLTEDDLYDLNFAFVYACGIWGLTFDYSTFDKSLEYQFDMLEGEDDE